MSAIDIQQNERQQRFEAVVDNELCVLEYERDNSTISMNHVRVPEVVGGRGIAGELTRHALDWAEEQGLKVQARCPYVASWIERHPKYERLLA